MAVYVYSNSNEIKKTLYKYVTLYCAGARDLNP
jgi:hypothetical protein